MENNNLKKVNWWNYLDDKFQKGYKVSVIKTLKFNLNYILFLPLFIINFLIFSNLDAHFYGLLIPFLTIISSAIMFAILNGIFNILKDSFSKWDLLSEDKIPKNIKLKLSDLEHKKIINKIDLMIKNEGEINPHIISKVYCEDKADSYKLCTKIKLMTFLDSQPHYSISNIKLRKYSRSFYLISDKKENKSEINLDYDEETHI
jgi:hypothetical protein